MYGPISGVSSKPPAGSSAFSCRNSVARSRSRSRSVGFKRSASGSAATAARHVLAGMRIRSSRRRRSQFRNRASIR